MVAMIYLEDGSIFVGKGFGDSGTAVGELVFNTSMTGYGEILSDPSYAGQIVTMTYPLIGNYGITPRKLESDKIFAKGLIVKNIEKDLIMSEEKITIDTWMKENKLIGISDLDTRALTKKIRKTGPIKCVITTESHSINMLKSLIDSCECNRSAMKTSGTRKAYTLNGKGPKIAVLDFGIKKSILNAFVERGCHVKVFPYDTIAKELIQYNPDGFFLSNGPGDPEFATEAIDTISELIGKKPIFGICMGHQLLARAIGAKTYKMPYGHRGGNHGVYDIAKDKAYITSQNHGYAICEKSLAELPVEITHLNLNDGTVEGIRHKIHEVFSVQYHPEGGPGPNDSTYLFDQFISEIKGEKDA